MSLVVWAYARFVDTLAADVIGVDTLAAEVNTRAAEVDTRAAGTWAGIVDTLAVVDKKEVEVGYGHQVYRRREEDLPVVVVVALA